MRIFFEHISIPAIAYFHPIRNKIGAGLNKFLYIFWTTLNMKPVQRPVYSDKGWDISVKKGEPAIQGFAALEFRIPE